MPRTFDLPPSLDDIARLGHAAVAAIPDPWRAHLGNVLIRVEEICDERIEAEMGLESPYDLLGLYCGVSLDRQSVADIRTEIDVIRLYRLAILDYWCETGEDLTAIVRHVVVHEIGHHFGLSDEEMQRIEDQA
jgi:predicted Zn-dependent protease with MMP-like domain